MVTEILAIENHSRENRRKLREIERIEREIEKANFALLMLDKSAKSKINWEAR
jgi:hypothetical protein